MEKCALVLVCECVCICIATKIPGNCLYERFAQDINEKNAMKTNDCTLHEAPNEDETKQNRRILVMSFASCAVCNHFTMPI